MNYNITRPKEPPKKYFNYQNIFFITFALSLIYIFSRVFVQDAVFYKMLAEARILKDPSFSYSPIISFMGQESFSLFLDFVGRICLPLSIFCIFLCIKNNDLNIIAVCAVAVFMECFHHYFNSGGFNFKNNSEFMIILFSIPFFYAWDSVKRVKLKWLIRLIMAILFVVLPIFLNIRNSLLYSLYIVSLAYFDPVRLNQAVFGAIPMFVKGTTAIASAFIYFYDEDFNRKKSNLYFLIFIPVYTIFILFLRNKFLG